MLYFLLSWCLLLGVTLALGAVVFADLAPRVPDRVGDRMLLAIWLGTGVTAIVLLIVSFVTPLTPVVGLALWLTVAVRSGLQWRTLWEAIAGATPDLAENLAENLPPDLAENLPPALPPKPRQRPFSIATLLGFGLVAVGLAAWIDRPVVWHDTGYYHASLIQWLGTYGTVPGLSLLFSNLGFTSAWFALSTPFNPVMFLGRPLAMINGFAFLLLLVQWALGVRSIRQHRARLADYYSVIWGTLLIPITLFLDPLSNILISPSPDLPVTILVGAIAWVMLLVGDGQIKREDQREDQREDKGRDKGRDNRDRLIPVMLAVVAVSFKLVALPLLPMTLAFALWRQPLRVWLTTGAIVIGGLLPVISGNLITSGCPLYPSNLLCLDLPWSPSRSAIAQVAQNTHGWMTWYGTPPAGANPWLWSIGQWWDASNKEKITAIGIVLGLLSLLVVLGREWIGEWTKLKKDRKSILRQLDNRPELWVGLTGLVGIGFVMLTSPFFRFSAPYILTLFSISGAVVLARVVQRSRPSVQGAGELAVEWATVDQNSAPNLPKSWPKLRLSIGLALITLCLVLHRSTLLMPPPMAFSSAWVSRTTNGIQYSAPQSGDIPEDQVAHKDMCWNAPIPCAYRIEPFVHLRDRDRGIAGGFVRRGG